MGESYDSIRALADLFRIVKIPNNHIYCKVKNRIQTGKLVILSDQDVHVYGYGGWKLLSCGLSPFINSFLRAWLSFFLSLSFFMDLHVSNFFFLFFLLFFYAWTFMCPFFSIAHVSFVTKDGERETTIT